MKLRSLLSIFALVSIFSLPTYANSYGVRVNPLTLLVGLVDGEVDIAIDDQFVIAPLFTTWNLNLSNWNIGMTGLGVGGYYYFDKNFSDSWYVGAFARSLSLTMKYTSGSVTGSGSSNTTAFGGNFGYMWQWSSFYMNLGGSLSSSSTSTLTVSTSSGTQSTTMPAYSGFGLDWKLGFSF